MVRRCSQFAVIALFGFANSLAVTDKAQAMMPPSAYEDAMSNAAGTALVRIDRASLSRPDGHAQCDVTGRIVKASTAVPRPWGNSTPLPKFHMDKEQLDAISGRVLHFQVPCVEDHHGMPIGGLVLKFWSEIQSARYMTIPLDIGGDPVNVFGFGIRLFDKRPSQF